MSVSDEAMDPPSSDKIGIKITDLYRIRDTYFPLDPAEKRAILEKSMKEILSLLDNIPQETRKQPSRRAQWEYWRGKTLDAGSEYCKEAEDHLSKAVKLDPSLVDAWSCLGNCFWKKNDLNSAKNCLTLALSKGPNKRILQQLSMLERCLAKGTPDEAAVIEESITHAKQAIELDIKDGQSWYGLGNAYLTSFFATGAWDRNKLCQSLKAYQNAEKDDQANSNPDLYFNSAIAYQYLEDYESALKAYNAACERDPGLPGKSEIEKTVKLLAKLEDLTTNKGRLKPKKFASLVASIPSAESGICPASMLKDGLNKGMVVACKVLVSVPHDKSVPLYYIASDSEGNCFVLSVYALRSGLIRDGSSITLLEPFFQSRTVSWEDKVYTYKGVRIDRPQQLKLGGQSISPKDAVCSIIHSEHIPS